MDKIEFIIMIGVVANTIVQFYDILWTDTKYTLRISNSSTFI